ncbi:MAG TPA: universal stress protein [Aggregatilineales bacterium]|nr:universal stress protein [Aggregatilineales bacterium]
MGYRNILIPLDGSDLAELALGEVQNIADPQSHVHLLSIVNETPLNEMEAFGMAASQTMMAANAQISATLPAVAAPEKVSAEVLNREHYLRVAAEKLCEKGFEVSTEVQSGHVIDTIHTIMAKGYDMVIMSTHGRTGLSKLVLGSVAEGVLHGACCPVLLVKATAAQNR